MSASNTIRWFAKPSFDEPKLRSPQPCARGIHCDFRRWNPATKQMEPAVCHFVHPGEEGTGRRLFPARRLADGRQQPACVRLTGAAQGFYERCGRKIPWGTWCAQKGIPYTPVTPGAAWEPVTVERIGGGFSTPQRPRAERPPPMAPQRYSARYGDTQLSMEQWSDPDCRYCEPSSGCDGDHGDEMRDGFIVRKLIAYAQETANAAAQVNDLEKPDANGRMWYDSKTPVGALAKALMACEKLDKSWHPFLQTVVNRSTPEELAAELGPADKANIENTPWHYAEHVAGRAARIQNAQGLPRNLEALLGAVASAATDEEHDRLEKELEAMMDS
jgi:hypothetical protein